MNVDYRKNSCSLLAKYVLPSFVRVATEISVMQLSIAVGIEGVSITSGFPTFSPESMTKV